VKISDIAEPCRMIRRIVATLGHKLGWTSHLPNLERCVFECVLRGWRGECRYVDSTVWHCHEDRFQVASQDGP
jgi:hypothetical protein